MTIAPEPVRKRIAAAARTEFLILVQSIIFNTPFASDNEAAEKEDSAAVEMEAARAGGAAWTAWAAMAVVRVAAGMAAAFAPKSWRSFSIARKIRCLAASSEMPRVWPISSMERFSK